MNHKISRYIKRLLVSSIALIIFAAITFFVFIAPHRTLPILMYHSILENKEQKDALYLPKNVFKNQMKYLSENDYNVISLEEAAKMVQKGMDFSKNTVVLTFDDGKKDFYSHVYPILKEYGFHAS